MVRDWGRGTGGGGKKGRRQGRKVDPEEEDEALQAAFREASRVHKSHVDSIAKADQFLGDYGPATEDLEAVRADTSKKVSDDLLALDHILGKLANVRETAPTADPSDNAIRLFIENAHVELRRAVIEETVPGLLIQKWQAAYDSQTNEDENASDNASDNASEGANGEKIGGVDYVDENDEPHGSDAMQEEDADARRRRQIASKNERLFRSYEPPLRITDALANFLKFQLRLFVWFGTLVNAAAALGVPRMIGNLETCSKAYRKYEKVRGRLASQDEWEALGIEFAEAVKPLIPADLGGGQRGHGQKGEARAAAARSEAPQAVDGDPPEIDGVFAAGDDNGGSSQSGDGGESDEEESENAITGNSSDSGDSESGDSESGDSVSGESVSGGSVSGESVPDKSVSGESVSGEEGRGSSHAISGPLKKRLLRKRRLEAVELMKKRALEAKLPRLPQEVPEGESRKLNREIATNRGLTRWRKKIESNARVALKTKFRRKLQEHKKLQMSADPQSGSGDYAGESRGITVHVNRARTVT